MAEAKHIANKPPEQKAKSMNHTAATNSQIGVQPNIPTNESMIKMAVAEIDDSIGNESEIDPDQ